MNGVGEGRFLLSLRKDIQAQNLRIVSVYCMAASFCSKQKGHVMDEGLSIMGKSQW